MTIPAEPGVWRKSSRSQNTTDCVEVRLGAVVGVRDTKDRDGGAIALPGGAWSAFLAEVSGTR